MSVNREISEPPVRRIVASRNEAAAAIEALPDGTVVADTTDDVFQLRDGLWCSYESVPLTGFQLAKYAPITILRHGGAK